MSSLLKLDLLNENIDSTSYEISILPLFISIIAGETMFWFDYIKLNELVWQFALLVSEFSKPTA